MKKYLKVNGSIYKTWNNKLVSIFNGTQIFNYIPIATTEEIKALDSVGNTLLDYDSLWFEGQTTKWGKKYIVTNRI